MFLVHVFFFKQKTAYEMRISDWSSDVCSSDLPVSGFTIDEIEPRLFSFNNPYGACPACDGLGITLFFDPELVVPDPALPPNGGAVAPWSRAATPSPSYQQTLDSIARHFKVSTRPPWAAIKPAEIGNTAARERGIQSG